MLKKENAPEIYNGLVAASGPYLSLSEQARAAREAFKTAFNTFDRDAVTNCALGAALKQFGPIPYELVAALGMFLERAAGYGTTEHLSDQDLYDLLEFKIVYVEPTTGRGGKDNPQWQALEDQKNQLKLGDSFSWKNQLFVWMGVVADGDDQSTFLLAHQSDVLPKIK